MARLDAQRKDGRSVIEKLMAVLLLIAAAGCMFTYVRYVIAIGDVQDRIVMQGLAKEGAAN